MEILEILEKMKDKEKMKAVIMGILLVAAFILLFAVYKDRVFPKKTAHAAQDPAVLMERIDVALDSIKRLEAENLDISSPAMAKLKTVSPTISIMFTGVAWNNNNPLAFVNGLVLGLDDPIGDATLKEINEENIMIVDSQGKEITVYLYEEKILKKEKSAQAVH